MLKGNQVGILNDPVAVSDFVLHNHCESEKGDTLYARVRKPACYYVVDFRRKLKNRIRLFCHVFLFVSTTGFFY